ncbi:hypothetical protein GQ457_07G028320 [Hibiscus cannabinus]
MRQGKEKTKARKLVSEILSDMKRDFSADPEYWDWLARLEMSDDSSTEEKNDDAMLFKLQKAVQVYEEAIKTVYEKAEAVGCLKEELDCQYISFYAQLGRLEEAKKVTENLCSGKLRF